MPAVLPAVLERLLRHLTGDLHGLVGAKAVGSSGNRLDLVVETFHGAAGDLPFGAKPFRNRAGGGQKQAAPERQTR